MFEVRETPTYAEWFARLKDRQARFRIAARIRRVQLGNIGDWRSVGDGVSEIRIPYGPGYRVYFTRREQVVVILLCGGDKGSQERDIERARELARGDWP